MKKFEALIHGHGSGGAYIEIPFSVEQEYGAKGQLKVKATFDGAEYRGSLAKMGHPCHILLVRKDVRAKIGKNVGDTVRVTLEKDTEKREVEMPEALVSELEILPDLKEKFDSLSFTNRKEYAQWISSAKREETRHKRLYATLDKLSNGFKNPYEKG